MEQWFQALGQCSDASRILTSRPSPSLLAIGRAGFQRNAMKSSGTKPAHDSSRRLSGHAMQPKPHLSWRARDPTFTPLKP
jgi:hypothetical protein